jgi:ankyrin repeat protein
VIAAIIAVLFAGYTKMKALHRQQDLNAALVNAVYHNDLQGVNSALAQGADTEIREIRDPEHSQPALLEALTLLFSPHRPRPAPPMTPLVEAAGRLNADFPMTAGQAPHEHIAVITALLDHHANIEAGSDGMGTALMKAAGDGMPQTVQLLLAHGAKVNTSTTQGQTALMSAVQSGGTVAIIRMLLDHGADVNAKTRDKETVLMVAAQWQHPEFVKLLLEHGADCNARDKSGDTAIMFAKRAEAQVRGNAAGALRQREETIIAMLKQAGEKE